MARPSSKDPLDKFRWAVIVDGFTRSGFTTCDVPSYTIGIKNYAEGGSHLFPRKIVDTVEYSPVTLTRGVTSDNSFHLWATQYFQFLTGSVTGNYKRDVKIIHLNRQGNKVKTYKLYGAFPTEYKPADTFSADGDDAISMEKLVLAYEGFEVIYENQDSNPNDPRDLIKRLINRF